MTVWHLAPLPTLGMPARGSSPSQAPAGRLRSPSHPKTTVWTILATLSAVTPWSDAESLYCHSQDWWDGADSSQQTLLQLNQV